MAEKKLASRLEWNEMLGFEQVVANRGAVRTSDHRVGAKVGEKPGVKPSGMTTAKLGLKVGPKVGGKIGLKTGSKPNGT